MFDALFYQFLAAKTIACAIKNNNEKMASPQKYSLKLYGLENVPILHKCEAACKLLVYLLGLYHLLPVR